jgi:hypothetical protein
MSVEKAIADRKIMPSQKEWATSYAKTDPEGWGRYLETTTAVGPAPGKAVAGQSPADVPADKSDGEAYAQQIREHQAKLAGEGRKVTFAQAQRDFERVKGGK